MNFYICINMVSSLNFTVNSTYESAMFIYMHVIAVVWFIFILQYQNIESLFNSKSAYADIFKKIKKKLWYEEHFFLSF